MLNLFYRLQKVKMKIQLLFLDQMINYFSTHTRVELIYTQLCDDINITKLSVTREINTQSNKKTNFIVVYKIL